MQTSAISKVLVLSLAITPVPVWGQVFSSTSFNSGVVVPDNLSSGATSRISVAGLTDAIQAISVSLQLTGVGSGGFNGDLYVLLSHEGKSSILLNRPGKSVANPFGYGDNGMSVTFQDTASNGDIHLYQSVSKSFGGPLTGTWAPDGRRADPSIVTDTSPRDAGLSNFFQVSGNGMWNLFLADLSGGGQVRLDSWSVNITTVPEPPQTSAVMVLLVAAGIVGTRHMRKLVPSVRQYIVTGETNVK